MKSKQIKIILGIILIIVLISGISIFVINKINLDDIETNMTEDEIDSLNNNIQIYDMTEEQISKLPSIQIEEKTLEEEEQTSKEQEVESEDFILQGEIAYEGSNEYPKVVLGNYVGLTYYNQTDSRWKDHSYTSVKNYSQTIGTSGCGPTSAAMIVTATKGTITPDQMGDLFVQYGYRSSNNGTYWSAFRWTADVFNLEYQETLNLDTAIELVRNDNYVVVSVGNGLFTTGGHFIVIVGIEGENLKIYDPYLYSGKFNTSTRRGKVTVSGNTVYCSIENFRNHANYKGFFAYKHDENVEENKGDINTSKDVKYVKTSTGIGVNVRSGPSTSYSKIKVLADGSLVTVYENKGKWSRIGENQWICSDYLTSDVYIKNTVNETRKTKACYLYSNSNLTGTRYAYKANTTVIILENVSSSVDKVKVKQTGRIAYIKSDSYK